ncbi:MAG: diadenylate cyclase [Candidatus Aureabacteria bacterium]|nr:diadenylate cyclase [Candidatus Auribacterota bacterium]
MTKRVIREGKKVKPATVTAALVRSAITIAKKVGAKALFVFGDVPIKFDMLRGKERNFKIVLVSANPETVVAGNHIFGNALQLPGTPLSRFGQITVSVIMAVSGKVIKPKDRIVFLTGGQGQEALDAIAVIDVGQEFSLLASPEMLDFTNDVDHTVFDQVIRIAIGIANEGREGHPVGTTLVLGDTREVLKHVEQMIINPFKGHSEESRQILNPGVQETIKELAQIDGAFIIRENGVVETAGVYISAQMVPAALPQGLGARHYSAAAITAATNAIAITVSQSTGDIYIFKGGQVLTCIEKNPGK